MTTPTSRPVRKHIRRLHEPGRRGQNITRELELNHGTVVEYAKQATWRPKRDDATGTSPAPSNLLQCRPTV